MSQVIQLVGWKGSSGLEITHGGDYYVLLEFRKQKNTSDVVKHETRVPVSIVDNLRRMIRSFPLGEKFTYRDIVDMIKKDYGLFVNTDAWNGGRNRSEYYFPLHYYPIKILEHEGFVSYDGRGNVRRLK